MTILEELIDIALRACEKSRQSGKQKYHHARGVALLTASGQVGEGGGEERGGGMRPPVSLPINHLRISSRII